jgi:hypothetical protein
MPRSIFRLAHAVGKVYDVIFLVAHGKNKRKDFNQKITLNHLPPCPPGRASHQMILKHSALPIALNG